jgi:RNA polymerase sigma-70 factor (ECF subfamily)
LIEKGKYYLEIAAGGEMSSEYHMEAAIAGCHACATSFAATDWRQILKLYDMLMELRPGSIVQLNRAIATGYAISPQDGLRALQEINDLEDHYLYYAALGDFYAKVGDVSKARVSYERAVILTRSNAEKNLLQSKLTKMSPEKL